MFLFHGLRHTRLRAPIRLVEAHVTVLTWQRLLMVLPQVLHLLAALLLFAELLEDLAQLRVH